MAFRTVGVCAYHCKQMVHQCFSTTYGDICQDCRTPRSGYKRVVEDRKTIEKQRPQQQ